MNDFPEMRQFLVRNFGQPAANLFPFADDGAGDVIAVREDPEQATFVFCHHETLKITEIGPFCEWLSSNVERPRSQGPQTPKKMVCAILLHHRTPEPILEFCANSLQFS